MLNLVTDFGIVGLRLEPSWPLNGFADGYADASSQEVAVDMPASTRMTSRSSKGPTDPPRSSDQAWTSNAISPRVCAAQ
jgi:hypothetical protein